MAKFKAGYLEDLNTVKSGLIGVITEYLNRNFSDLKDVKDEKDEKTQAIKWQRSYTFNFWRVFSSHGKEGYLRAINLLDSIQNATNSVDAIKLAITDSKDSNQQSSQVNELYTNILFHLQKQTEYTDDDDVIGEKEAHLTIINQPAAYNRYYEYLINTSLQHLEQGQQNNLR
jgi:hypothetical protein